MIFWLYNQFRYFFRQLVKIKRILNIQISPLFKCLKHKFWICKIFVNFMKFSPYLLKHLIYSRAQGNRILWLKLDGNQLLKKYPQCDLIMISMLIQWTQVAHYGSVFALLWYADASERLVFMTFLWTCQRFEGFL